MFFSSSPLSELPPLRVMTACSRSAAVRVRRQSLPLLHESGNGHQLFLGCPVGRPWALALMLRSRHAVQKKPRCNKRRWPSLHTAGRRLGTRYFSYQMRSTESRQRYVFQEQLEYLGDHTAPWMPFFRISQIGGCDSLPEAGGPLVVEQPQGAVALDQQQQLGAKAANASRCSGLQFSPEGGRSVSSRGAMRVLKRSCCELVVPGNPRAATACMQTVRKLPSLLQPWRHHSRAERTLPVKLLSLS